MIDSHIQHRKGVEIGRNYMYYHVSILKRLLGFDFQGLKKGFKEGLSTFGRNAGYEAIELMKWYQGILNTFCILSQGREAAI